MTQPPEVSVIIPTRDRWHLLSAHALPSALGQQDVDLEVLVVDDGSSDETTDGLARVRDPRLRVLRNEHTTGVSGARNTGIDAARGGWLAFLDDDDLWSPRKLRSQLNALGASRWGFASVVVVDESLRPVSVLRPPGPEAVAAALAFGNVVGGPSNVVAETELVRELGGFDEHLSHSADWDMWLRLAQTGTPGVCRDVLVGAVRHSQRMIVRDSPDIRVEMSRLFAKHGGASRRQQLAVAEWLAYEHRLSGRHLRAAFVHGRAGVRYRSPGNVVAALGALLGEPGLRSASRMLKWIRGASHLEPDRPPAVEPSWLQEVRSSLVAKP